MNSKRENTGFTLIEVALAIAVLALGVLALYSLLGAALDTSAKANADTQAAIFAEGVFNTLRAEAAHAAEHEMTARGSWTNFWSNFENGDTNVPVAFSELWAGNLAISNGGPYTVIFLNGDSYENTNIVNHSLRYSIDATLEWDNRANVLLKVWNGTFGPTSDTNALLFYSEFRKEGDL